MEMVRCLKIAVFVGFFVGCLEVANAQSLEIQKLQFASTQHLALHSGNVIEITTDVSPKSNDLQQASEEIDALTKPPPVFESEQVNDELQQVRDQQNQNIKSGLDTGRRP